MNTSSKTFLIILFCLLHNFSSFSQEIKSSFKGGEWFEFRIYYGIFNASYASLELSKDTIKKIPVFHAKGYGKTTGLARLFFKVEDHYESYFSIEKTHPVLFKRNIY